MFENEEWGEMETHNRLAQFAEGMWLVAQLAFFVALEIVLMPVRMVVLWWEGRA